MFGLAAVIFLFLFQYSLNFNAAGFNNADDYQAYFVFPEKMLQTGSLGNDYFSERRLIGSLGGQYFLDTFSLGFLDWRSLQGIDRDVGLLLLLAVVISAFKKIKISKRIKIFFLLCLSVVIPPQVNITALVIPISLFLFFLVKYFSAEPGVDEVGFVWRRSAIIALIVFATTALKNSLVPMIGSSFLLYYICMWLKFKDKKIIAEFIFSTLLILFLALPWMIALYNSSGTFFYPLLGAGFSGAVYGNYYSAYAQMNIYNLLTLIIELFNLSFIVLAFLAIYFNQEIYKNKRWLVLFGLAGVNILISAFSTGTYGLNRFTFSYVFAFDLFFLLELFKANGGELPAAKNNYRFGVAIVLAIILGFGLNNITGNFVPNVKAIGRNFKAEKLVSDKDVADYLNLQNSIPAGAKIITRLNEPFLLDFKRNTIYIADYPGGASLPPGMPFKQGPEALANYFLSNSIKYIAYSYASQANFAKADFAKRLKPSTNAWLRSEAENTFDFQDNLLSLSRERKIIYDDGQNFILDLSAEK